MAGSMHPEDDLLYQQIISKAYNQSTTTKTATTSRWKTNRSKWLIHNGNAGDSRITTVMKNIWKRTKTSIFFGNLNIPEAVVLEVDKFIATVHPLKKTGGNSDYYKSPGYIQWRKTKNTATLLCAIIHMIPFDTEIPWNMNWAEDAVLRDVVAMANGFKPSRSYPLSLVEKHHQAARDNEPQTETEAGTQQKSPTSEPETACCASIDLKTRRHTLSEQIRNLLIPETPSIDLDREMSLDEPEFDDPNMLVDYLRAEMQVQIAAAVRQVKRENYEQNVRNARAIELLMEERDKTLEGVVSALEHENTEAKKIISNLQATVSDNNKTISELHGVVSANSKTICDLQADVEKSAVPVPVQRRVGVESSTQTPPQITDLNSEEMHAILYGVLGNREAEQDGTMVLL